MRPRRPPAPGAELSARAVLRKAIEPVVSLFAHTADGPNHAWSMRLRLAESNVHPPELQGSTFVVRMLTAPADKVLFQYPALGTTITICRQGQTTWASPASRLAPLLEKVEATPPTAADRKPLASLRMPVPEALFWVGFYLTGLKDLGNQFGRRGDLPRRWTWTRPTTAARSRQANYTRLFIRSGQRSNACASSANTVRTTACTSWSRTGFRPRCPTATSSRRPPSAPICWKCPEERFRAFMKAVGDEEDKRRKEFREHRHAMKAGCGLRVNLRMPPKFAVIAEASATSRRTSPQGTSTPPASQPCPEHSRVLLLGASPRFLLKANLSTPGVYLAARSFDSLHSLQDDRKKSRPYSIGHLTTYDLRSLSPFHSDTRTRRKCRVAGRHGRRVLQRHRLNIAVARFTDRRPAERDERRPAVARGHRRPARRREIVAGLPPRRKARRGSLSRLNTICKCPTAVHAGRRRADRAGRVGVEADPVQGCHAVTGNRHCRRAVRHGELGVLPIVPVARNIRLERRQSARFARQRDRRRHRTRRRVDQHERQRVIPVVHVPAGQQRRGGVARFADRRVHAHRARPDEREKMPAPRQIWVNPPAPWRR